jgi:DNA polymerase II large subunit
MGYDSYDPTENETERMVTELYDYHERVSNLQYLPSEEEIRFMVKNLSVQIDGDPSEKLEVSRYKDLPRIETNTVRNGPCLVLGEGLCQKSPKLWKQLSKWGKDFDLGHWSFLEQFLEIQKAKKAKAKKADDSEKTKISPDYTFIKDLVAGRPVLTHPLHHGGFRLRYGRSRTSGFSSASIHPATMIVTNKYLATGTQLKMERPGKAAVLTACDSIEGPIIKLKNGTVIRLETAEQAKKSADEIEEILFLGDMLVAYGDFFNRAHILVPPGYCEEWWIQELEKSIVDTFGNLDLEKASELVEIPKEELELLIKDPFYTAVSGETAVALSKKLKVPLHPRYTYHWSILSCEDLTNLLAKLSKSNIYREANHVAKIVIPKDECIKRNLEIIGLPHSFVNNEFIVIERNESVPFAASLGISERFNEDCLNIIESAKTEKTLSILNKISEVIIRDKSGIFIGARMGRPEKAKVRKLTGSPHILFPVGESGGKMRSFQSALEKGTIKGDFAIFVCDGCKKETIFGVCENCGKKTKHMYKCATCGLIPEEICPKHGPAAAFLNKEIDINYYFGKMLEKLGTKVYPDLIKGVRGTSNKSHIPEHLVKGILRAKHEVYVNKDGTVRYDMTQIGITHFKPKEIGVSVEKLKELGYTHDSEGRPLEEDSQILELLPQDVILPACTDSPDEGADFIFFRAANFIDELLVKLYGLEPYYNLKHKEDLVGHLVIGLAPHTSAGIVGRIIGFSQTQGYLAHPLFHAAHRRDLDGDESCLMLLMDTLLNFSRHYLPVHRGSTQDAPLVLTSKLIPGEVDDMVFDMDVAWRYPLEFYDACIQFKNPWDVKIDQIKARLGTPKQYHSMGYTHPSTNINAGVRCSAYKILPSMEEKLKGQMDLAEKIRAVETSDVAALVIERHFIRDIKGNLRKFSTQQFRCVECNEKFRRPPLAGKCLKCGGKLLFTISEGSIVKYLEPSISLAEKYNLPAYLKQSLELVKRRIEGVFGKDKEKQIGLGKWFG